MFKLLDKTVDYKKYLYVTKVFSNENFTPRMIFLIEKGYTILIEKALVNFTLDELNNAICFLKDKYNVNIIEKTEK